MTNIYVKISKLHDSPPNKIGIECIFETVSGYFGIPDTAIMEHNRKYYIAEARQMAWKITRELTGLSFSSIGRYAAQDRPFDHTSVIHGIGAIQNRIDTEPQVKDRYNQLLHIIKNRK